MSHSRRPLALAALLLFAQAPVAPAQTSKAPPLKFDSLPDIQFEAPKAVPAPKAAARFPPNAKILAPPSYYQRHDDEGRPNLRRQPPPGRPAGPGWGPGIPR